MLLEDQVATFLLGVASSIVATVFGKVFIYSISIPLSYPYPHIKGNWKGTYDSDQAPVQEIIVVKQQFWKWISGTFFWSNPGDNTVAEYVFRGKFVHSDIVAGNIEPRSKRTLDCGSFLIKLDSNGMSGSGGIVSIDFAANEPRSHQYRLTRSG